MRRLLAMVFPKLFGPVPGNVSEGVTMKQLEQDEKNRKFISDLIAGHYGLPVDPQLRKLECGTANAVFKKWQETQKHMFDTAAPVRLELRNKYIKEKKFYEFFPGTISEDQPNKEEYEIFLKDAFTEPFPSLHDLPEWAIGTQMTDIMVLHGLSEADARRCYFHQKKHFVNHSMTQAIIWFDLYLKKH